MNFLSPEYEKYVKTSMNHLRVHFNIIYNYRYVVVRSNTYT